MSDAIASQLIRHDLMWLIPVTFEPSCEEALGGLFISAYLQEYINDFAILIDGAPQIQLLGLNFNEDLVDEKRIALASVRAP
jgi:hypothetical protein